MVVCARSVLLLGAGGTFGKMARTVLAEYCRVLATNRDGQDGNTRFEVEESDKALRSLLAMTDASTLVVNAIGVLADAIDAADPKSTANGITVNSLFPHRLAAAAAEVGAQVVHISTDAVFSQNCGLVFEDSKPAPDDVYGQTKLAGESAAPNVLSVRCSIIGPSPSGRRGLWEWFVNQPEDAHVTGFTNRLWSGVTSLQLAKLCAWLVEPDCFAMMRSAGPVAHFAPNPVISKYQLLCSLRDILRPDIHVERLTSATPVCRLLSSRSRGTWPSLSGGEWTSNIRECASVQII